MPTVRGGGPTPVQWWVTFGSQSGVSQIVDRRPAGGALLGPFASERAAIAAAVRNGISYTVPKGQPTPPPPPPPPGPGPGGPAPGPRSPGAGPFDYAQLEGLWIQAGGPPKLSPIAAAIAMAESGGKPDAHNPSGATGLWQILGNPFPGNAYDPLTNARMAVAKWKAAGGFSPWVTFTSGAYRQFLRKGVKPVAGEAGGGKLLPYVSPFGGTYTPQRIDQGVDFSGQGPILALGQARILYAGTGPTGWGPPAGAAPGGFIRYELLQGPAAHRQVYVAEGLYPTVHAGQTVQKGQQIGRMVAPIETGWASGAGTQPLSQTPQAGGIGGAGPFPTKVGQSFDQFLVQLGVRPSPQISGGGSGQLPSWLNVFNAAIAGLTGSGPSSFNQGNTGILGGLQSISQAVQGISDWLNGLSTAIDWLLQPSNWIRILAGVGGFVSVGMGVWAFTHVGGTGTQTRPMALAVGVFLVGWGGVLLLIAFHQLPPNVQTFSDLIGYAGQRVTGNISGQPASQGGQG